MDKIVRKKNVGNKRLKTLLMTAVAAFAAAAALLGLSGFGFLEALRGPKAISAVGENDEGRYVLAEVNNIFGYYGEDAAGSRDAVVFMEGIFVTVRLPERYFGSADTIYDATMAELESGGDFSGTNQYFRVSGTVWEMDDDALAEFYDWYGTNGGTEMDFATVLSPYVIEADQIGGAGSVAVYVMSVTAGLCVLYVAVVMILAACGKFDLPPESPAALDESGEEAVTEEITPDEPLENPEKAEADEEAEGRAQEREDEPDIGDEDADDV